MLQAASFQAGGAAMASEIGSESIDDLAARPPPLSRPQSCFREVDKVPCCAGRKSRRGKLARRQDRRGIAKEKIFDNITNRQLLGERTAVGEGGGGVSMEHAGYIHGDSMHV